MYSSDPVMALLSTGTLYGLDRLTQVQLPYLIHLREDILSIITTADIAL